jgi:hypothetical protein
MRSFVYSKTSLRDIPARLFDVFRSVEERKCLPLRIIILPQFFLSSVVIGKSLIEGAYCKFGAMEMIRRE